MTTLDKQAAAKILHLHSSFDLGGKEARAVQLMNKFGKAAHHTIISAVPSALSARDAIDPKIKVEFPDETKGECPPLHGKPALRRYQQISDYMRGFDLILSYNWGAMDGVMAHTVYAKSRDLAPLIHHEDGFNHDEIEKLNWKRNLFRMIALQRVHAMIVPSQILKDIAINIWKQPSGRVIQIANGINLPKYAKKPQLGSFPGLKKRDGEVIVGTVAGLRPVKNLTKLVRAVALAGDHVKLAIAGEGPDKNIIIQEAEHLGMADRLIMPGFMKDPARYIGLFDIFALSSLSEQYPISLAEAMAAGVPAVSTDVGDVRNMVSASNRDFIVDRLNDDAYNKALKILSDDPALRAKIGSDNQEKAQTEFDENIMFSRYKKIYGAAMGRDNFAQ